MRKNLCSEPEIIMTTKPEQCKLIANGKKTIDIRKSKPKLKPPFKCYIYCPCGNNGMLWILNKELRQYHPGNIAQVFTAKEGGGVILGNRKLIGEFVCNHIYEIDHTTKIDYDEIQMTPEELSAYADDKTLYGWAISGLVIYDEPKPIDGIKMPTSWCYAKNLRTGETSLSKTNE